MFDGLSADILEFCLEIDLQGDNLEYENGSLLEKDKYGIAKKMGISNRLNPCRRYVWKLFQLT
jgi:hypothetical protein